MAIAIFMLALNLMSLAAGFAYWSETGGGTLPVIIAGSVSAVLWALAIKGWIQGAPR